MESFICDDCILGGVCPDPVLMWNDFPGGSETHASHARPMSHDLRIVTNSPVSLEASQGWSDMSSQNAKILNLTFENHRVDGWTPKNMIDMAPTFHFFSCELLVLGSVLKFAGCFWAVLSATAGSPRMKSVAGWVDGKAWPKKTYRLPLKMGLWPQTEIRKFL